MNRSLNHLLVLLLIATASAFAPTRQHHQSMLIMPSSQTSRSSLNGASFDEYSQTEPDQDLAYEDTVVGTGDVAMEGKLVTVAYKGTLMSNGKKFDEGPGISFRLGEGRVISGWERGIVGMRVGGKRILRIPPRMAYGDRGAGDAIPPGAHLEFDCELKAIASNQMEEKMAEASSMNPFKAAATVFVGGSIIYDVLHFVLHKI